MKESDACVRIVNPMPFPANVRFAWHEYGKGRHTFDVSAILPWWRRLPCFLGWHKDGRISLHIGEEPLVLWVGCFRCGKEQKL